MPIQSTNPIEVDGIVYPYFMINLAISPLVKPTEIGGSVAMLLTPYRVLEDGSLDSVPDNALQFTYMDVFESNDAEALEATFTIMTALQKFITDKNI